MKKTALLFALLVGCTATAASDMDVEAAKATLTMKRKLGEGFIVERDGLFLIAGNLSRAQFERYCRHTIGAGSRALWSAYCTKKPDHLITIYLFRDDKTYRHWAKKLFNDTDVSHYGYYRPWDHTLVMNIGTGGGTLVHELTHALVKPDFPKIPTWFDEGLSSLHEQCSFARGTIVGAVNWRLPAVQEAIKKGTLVPLTTLVATTTRQFRGAKESLHYAEARYLCMYLQKLGVLRKFYKEFRDGFEKDPTGAKTLVKVTGKPIPDLQREWVAWVQTLRWRR
ncbi:hypothetical protein HQ560_22280 [bacterium]|nr:hypothetical protein [bacterium]